MPTATTTTSDARRDFANLCSRVAYGGERVIIERRGTARVALIPAELLEEIEDKLDLRATLAALKDAEEQGTITWGELKRELGL